MTLKEIISKLKMAVGTNDWDLVMEMIEELEILLRKEEFGNDMINTWDEEIDMGSFLDMEEMQQ